MWIVNSYFIFVIIFLYNSQQHHKIFDVTISPRSSKTLNTSGPMILYTFPNGMLKTSTMSPMEDKSSYKSFIFQYLSIFSPRIKVPGPHHSHQKKVAHNDQHPKGKYLGVAPKAQDATLLPFSSPKKRCNAAIKCVKLCIKHARNRVRAMDPRPRA